MGKIEFLQHGMDFCPIPGREIFEYCINGMILKTIISENMFPIDVILRSIMDSLGNYWVQCVIAIENYTMWPLSNPMSAVRGGTILQDATQCRPGDISFYMVISSFARKTVRPSQGGDDSPCTFALCWL